MPTHLGGDCEQTPSRSRRQNLRLQKEARSLRALTERPACFEIGPRGVRSSAPIGYGCRTQLITAYNGGSISSSRCQTTCIAAIDEINAIQIQVHGRACGKSAFASGGSPSRSRGAAKACGARRDRTDDLLLAKQALSQLSYGPGCERFALERVVGLGRLELPTSRLSSARSNQLSYKPKNPRSKEDLAVPRTLGPKTGRHPFRMNGIRHGLVHERNRNEDGGVLPMDLTDPETGWP